MYCTMAKAYRILGKPKFVLKSQAGSHRIVNGKEKWDFPGRQGEKIALSTEYFGK